MLLRRYEFNYPKVFIQIGKRTYSMFLLHFLFAYYGVSYVRKILVHAGIEGKSVAGFIIGYILVVLLSYITGGWLEKLTGLPLKWYKKKVDN